MVNEVERQRRAGKPVRIIILKARQIGFSTLTEALMFVQSFAYPNSFGLVVAHNTDSAEGIFDMTRRYWETWPFKNLFNAKYHSKRELAWEEENVDGTRMAGSAIRIATAKSQATGRGRTITFLHASEVGFWDDPQALMTGLRQTIPNEPSSVIILESTANGLGNFFHQTWNDAVDGLNEYTPMFFPWWRHPEYTASAARLTMPPLGKLDDEEKFLSAKLGVDNDHLQWRRWALPNLLNGNIDDFHQEYPSTPEEAFITSGSPVFDLKELKVCYAPEVGKRGMLIPDSHGKMIFQPSPTGPLKLFALPSSDRDWGQYFVAGDPAHAGGYDFACAQVINRRMYEQVAVWHGKIDPIAFGDELVKLARFYNDAEISSEVEGPGYATIARLISLEWPNLWRHRWPDRLPGKVAPMFGWSTNWKRKDWMIAEMQRLILDHSLLIHDQQTYDEMREYVTLSGPVAEFGPADAAGHDDRVMALAICIVCSRTEGPVMAFEGERQLEQPPVPEWAEWVKGAVAEYNT